MTQSRTVSTVVKKEHNQLFEKREELSLETVRCLDELAKIEVIKDYIYSK